MKIASEQGFPDVVPDSWEVIPLTPKPPFYLVFDPESGEWKRQEIGP